MRLRRATDEDAAAIAVLFRQVWKTCLPYLPVLHTPDEDQAFFAGAIGAQSIWMAEDAGAPIGFAAAASGWLNHLYVDPTWHGRGAADSLLYAACPAAEVRLWCFQRNGRARRFYERRGFAVERLTDGAGNEEREPESCWYRRDPSSTADPARAGT